MPDDIIGLRYPTYLFHINDAEDIPLERLHVLYNRVFPGEGVANAEAWVRAAIQSGYRGYFSLEIFQQQVWDMSPENAALLCYDKLSKFAESVG
jgi:sugar phosphate isomerase/epimerase